MPPEPAAVPADWLPATGLSAPVRGLMTTRAGGVSPPPFDSLNLRPVGQRADAVDAPEAVAENQRRLQAVIGAQPVWLNQVHGARVVRLGLADLAPGAPVHDADASVTAESGLACTVLVADCLPVLFAAPQARAVGAAHAGWRGLAAGVLEATVAALCELAQCGPAEVEAWLGACIGPRQFEVGADVVAAFGPAAAPRFVPRPAVAGKWLADLPGLARDRLSACGVRQISGGVWCTVEAPSRFFSFRRDRLTGRHAAVVWMDGALRGH